MNQSASHIKRKIVLIGCGHMGGALLDIWLKNDTISQILVINPSEIDKKYKSDHRVQYSSAPQKPDFETDAILLAVKPQRLETVASQIRPMLSPDSLIISVIAGKPLSAFRTLFGNGPVIRTMPNMPAAIGKGITAGIGNVECTENHYNIAEQMMRAAGKFIWIDNEDDFHAIVALSGSGPAYIFLLTEILTSAGIKMGLSPELSETLARQTVIGSASLLEASPEIGAEKMRGNIATPGGTTEAALKILMDEGVVQEIFNRALKAARDRSKTLSEA